MDKRYILVVDHIAQASAILQTIRSGPIELSNLLKHTSAALRRYFDATRPSATVIDFAAHRDDWLTRHRLRPGLI